MRLFILLLTILTATTTHGAVSTSDRALVERGDNLLKNGGFESGRAQWTASGGTFTTTTTAANVGKGSVAASWDSSSASQTLTSTAVAIPAGMYGRNGVASCIIQGASATHTIQAYDGSNILASTTITSQASYARTSVNFIFPSSGSVSLRLVSANANEPSIAIDDCYLGDADGYNISQISQANLIGSAYFATTANCTFTRTSTSLGAFSDADCPGPTVEFNAGPGVIQTTDANAPVVTVNNLSPGTYIAHFIGQSEIQTSAQRNSLAISDGTTTSGQVSGPAFTSGGAFHVTGVFNYTTAGNKSFELYGSSAANAIDIVLTTANQRLYFYLERFPTSSEIAYRADLVNRAGQIKITGAASCLWTTNSASYASFTADADCGAQTVIGSATAPGTKLAAGTFTSLPAGKYLAIANGKFTATYAVSSTDCLFQLWDGTNSIANIGSFSTSGTAVAFNSTIAGIVSYSSFQPSISLEVRGMLSSGGGTCDIRNPDSNNSLIIQLIPIDQNLPMPALVGSVTSNTTGQERIESAAVTTSCTASPCTIASQSGSWLTSITRASTGTYTANIAAGMFASAPRCVLTATSSEHTITQSSVTTSSFAFNTTNSSGVAADTTFVVMCMGPR